MAAIGLVTVLYNSDNVLNGFFRSIFRQQYKNYILYLIDNSPSDSTDALLHQLVLDYPLPNLKHIKSKGNIGVAAGNNIGIKMALAEGCSHILLLNNDIEIEQQDVLEKMVQLTTTGKEMMVVPKIYYYDSKKLWMAGGYINKWKALGVHVGFNKAEAPAYNKAKYISYAPTCFMLVRKEVFDKIGFMDEKYFAYYDDVDFVWRATQSGFRLYYDPSISILHKVSSSAGTNSSFYVYYSNRNKIYFIRKNFSGLWRYIPVLYALLSRIAFYIRFDKEKKQKLIQGLRDGFNMKMDSNKV